MGKGKSKDLLEMSVVSTLVFGVENRMEARRGQFGPWVGWAERERDRETERESQSGQRTWEGTGGRRWCGYYST